MKVKVKKSFATRTKGYKVGSIVEVSEAEYKDFINFVEPVKGTSNNQKEEPIVENTKESSKKKKIEEVDEG